LNIVVTFALDAEFAPWRSGRGFRRTGGGSFAIYEMTAGEANVRVAITGVGSVNARRAVRHALGEATDVCISSGFAGGLRSDLRCGEILAARAVRALDDSRAIASNPRLVRAAGAAGAREVGMFATSDAMLLTAEAKRRLSHSADAVEMESFSILAEAAAANVPSIAIRAVSDSLGEDLPLNFSETLDASGKVRYARVAAALVRAPQQLPALLRLGRRSRRAAKELARFLDSYVTSLSMREGDSERLAEFAAV
jgi:adenosylhomocysteine nucleosidase